MALRLHCSPGASLPWVATLLSVARGFTYHASADLRGDSSRFSSLRSFGATYSPCAPLTAVEATMAESGFRPPGYHRLRARSLFHDRHCSSSVQILGAAIVTTRNRSSLWSSFRSPSLTFVWIWEPRIRLRTSPKRTMY
ncbi:hypothetical protein C8Q79DRAFT_710249 [Trametes meyenii]|nr:hypothetical protein C8Q79DRAFT_710249 [Trametes meyenii]